MEEMSRCLSRRELLAALLLFTLLVLLTPSALGAHVAQLSGRELAAASSNVVVAVVEGREVRWNGKHTLLMTDYTLRVEERLRGAAPERFTLAMPGGTLGDITDEVCSAVELEPGARYLLFLGDLDRPSLSPILGARQGAFREGAGFDEVVAAARTLVEETPLALRTALLEDASLPAKTWISAPYVYTQPAHRPIVVDPLLPGTPFSPVDQEQLAYWNLYAGDLFRVADNPSETWSFGNGVFELVGFPSEKQMTDAFEVSWGDLGGNVLGVAFVRRKDGAVIEADVALNPAKAWTLDDVEATTRGGAYSFKEVMTHEVGHMWGLKHPFETQKTGWDSVMQYKSKVFYLGTIYADDAMAVRSAFPPGVAIRDGLVSSYVTYWESPEAELATYDPAGPRSSNAKAGGSFSLNGPIKIENAGTVPLANPKVEVYLVPRRFSFEGAVLVKTVRVQGILKPGATRQVKVSKIAIPAKVPPGTYWLGYYLRDNKDRYPANNGAWSNADVTLTVGH
ncbi:MAG TPA: matrixin family metalloprotease [Thermoanaerobaculia bacterium]|jgi:hypothetical protein|nr:matrixin family metalloprotease [Thermoanaerobaculia bacterium]